MMNCAAFRVLVSFWTSKWRDVEDLGIEEIGRARRCQCFKLVHTTTANYDVQFVPKDLSSPSLQAKDKITQKQDEYQATPFGSTAITLLPACHLATNHHPEHV
jgi:hypothetical protein